MANFNQLLSFRFATTQSDESLLSYLSQIVERDLWSIPAYNVFGLFAHESDPLQHVSDVVDAPLLHIKTLHRFVQIQHLHWCTFDELDKLDSEYD